MVVHYLKGCCRLQIWIQILGCWSWSCTRGIFLHVTRLGTWVRIVLQDRTKRKGWSLQNLLRDDQIPSRRSWIMTTHRKSKFHVFTHRQHWWFHIWKRIKLCIFGGKNKSPRSRKNWPSILKLPTTTQSGLLSLVWMVLSWFPPGVVPPLG